MSEARCSFCGKPQASVRRLVSSPASDCFICDNCIEICRAVVEDNKKKAPLKFNLPTPTEIKEHLDEFIVGQENAKRAMAVAVYNHYKRLNYNASIREHSVELDKSNILLIGPTGVGKTLIAKTLAKMLRVPFVCADATGLTEAGYVGDDVESILAKLIIAADYDVRRAEMGIVYIDEVDKIAKKPDSRNFTRDVSGEGVQQALLKILEGSTVEVALEKRRLMHQETLTIDTSNILFICGGAFVRLNEIVENRSVRSTVGFNTSTKVDSSHEYKYIENVRPNDLISFGLIPEFVGRLPVVVGLEPLNKQAMLDILTVPKNNLIDQYRTILKIDGVELSFEPKALAAIADRGLELNMGARGLRTIMEEIMLDIMYMSPSEKGLVSVVVTADYIQKRARPKLKYKTSKRANIANSA